MDLTSSLYLVGKNLSRQLNQMADEAFRDLGLSSSYAFLLIIVHEQPGIQPTQLSQKLQLTPSTITRLVEKMEYRGYLRRRSEGRSTHIELTQTGEQMQPKLEKATRKMARHHQSILGKRYVRVLTEMMQKATDQIKEANS